MTAYRIVSADSHMCEPPDLWTTRLDQQYRDRAPHTVKGHQGKDGVFFVCENIMPIPVSGIFGAGKTAEELPEHFKRGYEAAPPSVWDPAARIKEQEADGVSGEVLYTSFGMFLYGLDDAGLRTACFRAYNDFVAEYTSHDPKRLVGLGLIDLEDIGASVEEMKRIAKKGLRGVMIWASPPEDRPYTHPDYDPFWAAAQDLNMPLSLHILTSRRGMGSDFFKGNLARQVAVLHHEIERSLSVFVLDGVLERFPNLKIVSAENDVAWVPYFMWRMDFAQDRFGRSGATPVKLNLKPSEYLKRQVYATFINEPIFLNTLGLYGADNAMWSSDYPHTAAIWPRSQQFIKETFSGLSEENRCKIVHDTAARLYGID